MVNSAGTMQTKLGEWMWRFLAIVMMFSVGWTVWIVYQLNPPPLIMNAAFEAAAKAKGKYSPAEKQSSQGVIVPSGAAGVASAPTEAPAAAPKAPEVPKEPPVNPDKLKLTDTLAIPAPPGKK